MTHEQDAQFLLRRETEERAIAGATADPMIRSIHEVLAEGYADRGVTLKSNARHVGVVPASSSALVVTAVDGSVEIAAQSGEVTVLTPLAAELTSDSLLARARDAAHG